MVLGGRLGDGGGWLEVIAGICEQGEHLSQLDSIILLSSSCQQWTETRRVDWSGESVGHSRSLEWEAAQGANKGGRAKRRIGRHRDERIWKGGRMHEQRGQASLG